LKDRRNPLKRVTGIAESVAAGARRRQEGRTPRVVLYDAAGHSRLVAPHSASHDLLVDAAERLIDSSPPRP